MITREFLLPLIALFCLINLVQAQTIENKSDIVFKPLGKQIFAQAQTAATKSEQDLLFKPLIKNIKISPFTCLEYGDTVSVPVGIIFSFNDSLEILDPKFFIGGTDTCSQRIMANLLAGREYLPRELINPQTGKSPMICLTFVVSYVWSSLEGEERFVFARQRNYLTDKKFLPSIPECSEEGGCVVYGPLQILALSKVQDRGCGFEAGH